MKIPKTEKSTNTEMGFITNRILILPKSICSMALYELDSLYA